MEYVKIPNVFKREEGKKDNRLLEGVWSTPELEYLRNRPWVWTEKVDGTNVRVMWDGYEVSFGGRTDKAQMPVHLVNRLNTLFGGDDKEETFESHFGQTPCILFGEGFGEKIQSGAAYGPVDFILFDVFCGGMWLTRENVEKIAETFGIRCVPIVGSGPLPEAVEFIRAHPKSVLRDDIMEGVVCRPAVELADRRGNRIIVKIKCRDFKEN